MRKWPISAGVSLAFAAVVISATAALGATWSSQTSGTLDILKAVYFNDNCHGWTVGESAGSTADTPPGTSTPIVATTDGGKTWTAQSSGVTDVTLNRVQFVDNSNGWTVGEPKETNNGTGGTNTSGPGSILHTTNGGSTWSPQAGPPVGGAPFDQDWEGMSFISTTEGWIAGNSASNVGEIIHTADGGANYAAQVLPVAITPVADVSFVDANNGWAIIDNKKILHTSNGGVAGPNGWQVQTTLTDRMESIKFFDALTGVTVGDSGKVFWTTDGGTTWTAGTTPGGTNVDLKQISFVDATHLYVTTDGFVEGTPVDVLFSSDGGKTYSSVPVASNGLLLGGVSVAKGTSNAWLVGENGSIMASNATACPAAVAAVAPRLPNAGHPQQGTSAGVWLVALLLVPAMVVYRRLSRLR